MNRKSMKQRLRGLAATVLATASFGALAAPVTQWSFIIDSGFSAFAPTTPASIYNPTGSNVNPALALPSLLSWGEPATNAGQSSLGVGAATNGNASGSVFTNGAAVNTVQVTHTNQPVFAPSLTSATLLDRIILQALAPPSTTVETEFLLFNINFLETPNVTGTCVVPSPTGNPCNDIFVLDVVGAGFNPADNSLNQTFFYDGEDYNAILQIAGLAPLSSAACTAVGVAAGCIGFTTVEGQTNTFQVSLRITDTPFVVPEPASLGLLSLGLIGLGLARRRGKAA